MSRFHDFEDMTDDTWRSENSDNMYLGSNSGTTMWDGYPIFPTRNKWMDKVGLAEAITSSILSAGIMVKLHDYKANNNYNNIF